MVTYNITMVRWSNSVDHTMAIRHAVNEFWSEVHPDVGRFVLRRCPPGIES